MASWSATGSINGNFRLELNVWENWTSAENYSSVHWEVILRSTGNYSFSTIGSTIVVNVDGEVYNAYSQKNLNAGGAITIASGDKNIWHNSDGSKEIYCSATYTQSSTAYYTPGNMSCGGNMWLTHIPRYANFTQHYISSKSINTATVYWGTDAARDYTQYSLNSGTWIDAGDSVSGDNKSGTYTIKGLQPNTTYYIRTRIRRTDSGLWTESSNISVITFNTAQITSCDSTLKIGNTLNIKYNNPANAKVEIGIYKKDGNTAIVSYKKYDNNGIYNITEEETKSLYKQLKNNNSYITRVYIRTTQNNVSYCNWVDITIKATGNIKTANIKKEENIKKAFVYIKKEGKILKAVVWIKRNNKVKRCI
jgi:hypothetical protein